MSSESQRAQYFAVAALVVACVSLIVSLLVAGVLLSKSDAGRSFLNRRGLALPLGERVGQHC